MREIKLLIGEKERVFRGPSCYAEVPEKMLLPLRGLLSAGQQQAHYRLAIPCLLYGIPGDVISIFFDEKKRHRYQAEDGEPATLTLLGEELLNTCNWVYTEAPPSFWILQRITVDKRVQWAPAHQLANLTFGEFMLAETYLKRDLAKLCALLYRPGKSIWPYSRQDARRPFDESRVEPDAVRFRKPEYRALCETIAWNYQGMIPHLMQVFPHVFQKKKPDDLAVPEAPNATPWLDAALSMANEDPNRFRALEHENLYVVLKMLDNRIRQNKELEEKYRK
ncbi:hypothetical protein GCM10027275_24870 [Rhabdobacter roseus]|uniref:Uncharacterized protein n=1 Tax=Rhabdobacter roseus TaxID=1655419 RepID=A0A840TRT2_9BACT|nr:hypothetical protein [Rhabdobacter roseus]MBB5284427.1 hypothetical protein [Rhabdobacter roseus]